MTIFVNLFYLKDNNFTYINIKILKINDTFPSLLYSSKRLLTHKCNRNIRFITVDKKLAFKTFNSNLNKDKFEHKQLRYFFFQLLPISLFNISIQS